MLRKIVTICLLAGLLGTVPSHAQVVPQVGGATAVGTGDARRDFTVAIVKKWGAFVAERYQTDAEQWAANMAQSFANATLDQLAQAATAATFDAMSSALLGSSLAADTAGKLGDAAIDLVFIPVTPCRILDTRAAGGVIPANSTRDFDVTGIANYSSQGGAATDCGTGAAGNFAAAVINFTVVFPTGGGYITAYPYLGTQPLAATVNYNAGDIRGNLAVVKLDQSAALPELTIYTFAETHVVGDIVGYFINPQATDPECVNTTISTFNIAAGAQNFYNNPACPVGYKATTPYCWTATAGVYSQGGGFNANNAAAATFCSWQNTTVASQQVFGGNVCCRVPGR